MRNRDRNNQRPREREGAVQIPIRVNLACSTCGAPWRQGHECAEFDIYLMELRRIAAMADAVSDRINAAVGLAVAARGERNEVD